MPNLKLGQMDVKRWRSCPGGPRCVVCGGPATSACAAVGRPIEWGCDDHPAGERRTAGFHMKRQERQEQQDRHR